MSKVNGHVIRTIVRYLIVCIGYSTIWIKILNKYVNISPFAYDTLSLEIELAWVPKHLHGSQIFVLILDVLLCKLEVISYSKSLKKRTVINITNLFINMWDHLSSSLPFSYFFNACVA